MTILSEIHAADRDIELEHGGFRLRTSSLGAGLRGFWQLLPDGSKREIATSYSGAANKIGGQGDVLIPFPGRINAGKYRFNGESHQLQCNDKEGPNAIHGFLRSVAWGIADQSQSSIRLKVDLDAQSHSGYPFSLRAEITYSITGAGFECIYRISNIGDGTAPVAAGFHPYFCMRGELIDSCTLQLPFTATLEFENLIPTGRVLPVDGTEFDFRSPRRIGSTQFNTCFVDPERDEDGRMRVRFTNADGETTTVWSDGSLNYVVIYSGDPLPELHRRRSLAIEPMTCSSDGFNHPEWGLITLKPGASCEGVWGASV